MKISFDLEESEASGKHKFVTRLRNQLLKIGHEIVPMENQSDVHLFTRKFNKKSRINIYRVDGIWINSEQNYKDKNKTIIDSLKLSNGVIYQNEFCRDCVHTILKTNNINETCIMNGAGTKEKGSSKFNHDRPFFMSLCRWRPHKRLKDIIGGFIESNLDADLLIFGETPEIIKHKNVIYKGWGTSEALMAALRKSIASIHLAWLDWCPNSVVESLICGKQVIHTSSGGTKYVVKNRGHRIKDAEWDYKPHALYDPPALDISVIANAYVQSMINPISNFNVDDLNIENIAVQYEKYFNKVLNG